MLVQRMRRAGMAAVVLVGAFSMMIPSAAGAAEAAGGTTCLNAWGQVHPNVWCDPAFKGTLSPTDQPFGRGEQGDLYVRGVTAPGATVTVTVTDGVQTLYRTVVASTDADPSAGVPAGAFEMTFIAGHFAKPDGTLCSGTPGCPWMVGITDLGTHSAAPGATSDSTNPDDRGKSILTVAADSYSTTVTKYAATKNDGGAPGLSGNGSDVDAITCNKCDGPELPPGVWCHVDPFLIQDPLIGLGLIDLFGVGMCSEANRNSNGGHTGCSVYVGPIAIWDGNAYCPTGQINIHGTAQDADGFGIGSEIADVRLIVTQADELIQDISIMQSRIGTKAVFGHTVKIDDYESNLINCDYVFGSDTSGCYVFKVVAVDAWGNQTAVDSGNVTVTPF